MNWIYRTLASAGLGMVAMWFAEGEGLPLWRVAPTGDASDIGLLIMSSVYIILWLFRRDIAQ